MGCSLEGMERLVRWKVQNGLFVWKVWNEVVDLGALNKGTCQCGQQSGDRISVYWPLIQFLTNDIPISDGDVKVHEKHIPRADGSPRVPNRPGHQSTQWGDKNEESILQIIRNNLQPNRENSSFGSTECFTMTL
jgi:hypothetical protein